jgi:hypothetical protein
MGLDGPDLGENRIEGCRHLLVHGRRLLALDEVGLVAVALEQALQLLVADPCKHRRVGDLVAVEVQDRQDDAVPHRVEKLLECQEVASAPVSASPSPTTQATIRSGLSKAAPKACETE